MPKHTFYHLHTEKKEKILSVLKNMYEQKPFFAVNVKEIVEELGIARGSFYQYFENLEESYFLILEQETVDIHSLFFTKLKEYNFQVYEALKNYGNAVAEAIFHNGSYMIYKNRYLYWTDHLEKGWQSYLKKQESEKQKKDFFTQNIPDIPDPEAIHFVKAIIHDLIKRIFKEDWNEETFLKHFEIHLSFIKKGVHYGNH